MESQVNPKNVEERATAVKAAEDTAAAAETAKIAVDKAAADKATADAQVLAAKAAGVADPIKPVDKVEVSKQPNDPIELRKWATKASQENAALRDEIKAVKSAIEKLTKKPVDYKELAKNPEAIQKQIEAERAEAVAEMQEQLEEKTHLAIKNETVVERLKREQDTENYPEWKRVFPLIQTLSENADGRINFNRPPSDVLDALYQLAIQLMPAVVVASKVEPVTTVVTPVKTADEIKVEHDVEIAAAEKRGFEKAQAALRQEQNGQGLGSAGKGGRRSSGVSKEALAEMPLADLKKLISQE